MALAAQEDLPAVTLEILQRTAHSEVRLRKINTEAVACETDFAKEHTGLDSLMAELCPPCGSRSVVTPPESSVSVTPPAKRKRQPGNRKPTYDFYPAASAT